MNSEFRICTIFCLLALCACRQEEMPEGDNRLYIRAAATSFEMSADASTKAGVKIIMLQDLGEATGVEGVDAAAARIYTANGNIIIAAAEDGEAAVYDFTGRLIKSVPIASGDSTAVPLTPAIT